MLSGIEKFELIRILAMVLVARGARCRNCTGGFVKVKMF